ncbi:MAG: polyphosphate polymerase domain-containing protein [Verrucomicrobia bacterium]|nr:polyphosphate polymerase domain-containing protein [Verrucomicrobiota bacterium]
MAASASYTEKRDFAYEIKFLLPDSVADAALAWARQHLSPDPHALGPTGDGYHITSIYFDTPSLDVFHRVGSYGRCKYRVRRYGSEEAIFLERKLKTRGLVGKRRSRIAVEQIANLAGTEPDESWIGYWFHRRLIARELQPICQIAYQRIARVGLSDNGPIRFTVDRQIVASLHTGLCFDDSGVGKIFLSGQSILELKFRQTMPEIYTKLIHELSLTPHAVSKYRLTIQSFLPEEAEKAEPAMKDSRNGSAVHPAPNGQIQSTTRNIVALPERNHA